LWKKRIGQAAAIAHISTVTVTRGRPCTRISHSQRMEPIHRSFSDQSQPPRLHVNRTPNKIGLRTQYLRSLVTGTDEIGTSKQPEDVATSTRCIVHVPKHSSSASKIRKRDSIPSLLFLWSQSVRIGESVPLRYRQLCVAGGTRLY
jgi:hypothetical protein